MGLGLGRGSGKSRIDAKGDKVRGIGSSYYNVLTRHFGAVGQVPIIPLKELSHCDAAPQNTPADGAGVQHCTPGTPQPKCLQRSNNVVKSVWINMNSYLLGRRGGLDQLFSPYSR